MATTVRLRKTRGRVALGGLALLLLLGLGLLGGSSSPARLTAAERLSYAVVAIGNDILRTEVVAFNGSTGAVVRRLPAFYQPDIAVSPGGDRLVVLSSRGAEKTATATHVLELIDTRSWATLASTMLADRFLYNINGPPTMTLSPDGTRLFMYNSNAWKWDPVREPNTPLRYWLTVVDATSLQILPTQIPLPNCGGGWMTWAGGQLAVACATARTVHFVDPQALRIVASVDGLAPRIGLGLFTAPDQQTVYVVTADLAIVAIDARTHTVVRDVLVSRPRPVKFGSIPLKEGMAMTVDGQYLIVGLKADPQSSASAFSLSIIDATSLKEVTTVSLPRYASLAAAPGGGLYLFWVSSSEAADWGIQLLSPDFSQITQLVRLDGPVFRLVP